MRYPILTGGVAGAQPPANSWQPTGLQYIGIRILVYNDERWSVGTRECADEGGASSANDGLRKLSPSYGSRRYTQEEAGAAWLLLFAFSHPAQYAAGPLLRPYALPNFVADQLI